jgi:mannose-1-phosphate guanylyltransferase
MKKTALIMAGGRGERFWPKSRRNMPKQFLSLTDDGKTMIQLTVERILPIVDMQDIYISTNKDYAPLVAEQLPDIPKENILCEPIGRNTAPCIALGAAHIVKKYEDAIMIVLPSDHLIKYNRMFLSALREGSQLAEEKNSLVTIGIAPDYPETGYGYIKFKGDVCIGTAFEVDSFVEKPTLELAKEYLASDEYLWNSGMFLWKATTILSRFKQLLPDAYDSLMEIKDAIGTSMEAEVLNRIFPTFPSISIDYGIMEKSKNIFTIPGNFGWDDVGSWLSLGRIRTTNENGNIINGNVLSINTDNCIIEGSDKLIATIGLEDLIIVDTEDAILICDKTKTNDIKKVLENLKICNRNEYL